MACCTGVNAGWTVRRASRITAKIALLATMAACSSDPSAPHPPDESGALPPAVTPPVVPAAPVTPASIASIVMLAPTQVLTVGSPRQFFVAIKDSVGNLITGRTVSWKSSNVVVATVSSGGVVDAVSPGEIDISASIETHTAKTSVTVVAAGFGAARGVVRDGGNGLLLHNEARLTVLASSQSNPALPRQSANVDYVQGGFSLDNLGAGRWSVTMSANHWWSFVFPGLQLYSDTTFVLDVAAGRTTVIPQIVLRPRAPLLLVAVETCPFALPRLPTLYDWGDCDGGYWGGADVRVSVDGVAGTSTAGIHFETDIGPAAYAAPPDFWDNTPWSRHFGITSLGEYDVSLVRVSPRGGGIPWNLVPWETPTRRVRVGQGLTYTEFDFYWHQ